MDRRKFHIEKLLRRGYSKVGVLSKLSDLNMRTHWSSPNHRENELKLTKDLDDIFNKILNEGGYKIGYNKGGCKSEKLIRL